MTLHSILNRARNIFDAQTRQAGIRLAPYASQLRARASERPKAAVGLMMTASVLFGAMAYAGIGTLQTAHLRTVAQRQHAQLDQTRREAQREVNALAARMGELQAEANRLNALGERLTRMGQLGDGEFDFNKPVGVGGEGPTRDMSARDLRSGMNDLGTQLNDSGQQLSVLESLLFNRELDRSAMPSREPILNSYITSPFGGRADPFGGGHAFHKGIDFHANLGDPVLAVADGVVSYAGVRSGYGNVVEVDHGNGYVTRYAHNSRLLVQVGDLVRSGQQIAKAGSTGRSTGSHVHFEVWDNGSVVNPSQFLGGGQVKRG